MACGMQSGMSSCLLSKRGGEKFSGRSRTASAHGSRVNPAIKFTRNFDLFALFNRLPDAFDQAMATVANREMFLKDVFVSRFDHPVEII